MRVERSHISVKLSDEGMKERNPAFSFLLEMSSLFSGSSETENMWEVALEKVLELFGLSAGRIYFMDHSGENLLLAAHRGLEVEGLQKISVQEGFSGKAVRTRSFIAQPVSELEDGQRAAMLASRGLWIVICVPLIAMGEVIGVMNLAADHEIELNHDAIDLLIAIGNQMAIAAVNRRLYDELKSKIQALKVQKEAIEFFAYSISHDLKSPAVGIYGLTRRLHKKYCDALEETGKTYCEQILKAAEQIARLVDRINSYIMVKEAPLHFEAVKVKEVTEAVRTEFYEVIGRRNIRWVETDELPTIIADRICIARLFRNLVDNALKYGGDQLTEIRISWKEEPGCHVLSVYDDGVALEVEDSESIFQLFRRHKTSQGVEGTGLGLATVKRIAERHLGRVWMESGPEKGTTFYVSVMKGLPKGAEEQKPEEAL